MEKMTLAKIKTLQAFGYKAYIRKNKTAVIARYLSSKWWNPFDWFKVEIIDK